MSSIFCCVHVRVCVYYYYTRIIYLRLGEAERDLLEPFLLDGGGEEQEEEEEEEESDGEEDPERDDEDGDEDEEERDRLLCFLFLLFLSFFLLFLFSSFRKTSKAFLTVILLSSSLPTLCASGLWKALKYASSSSLESTKSYFAAFAAGSRPSLRVNLSELAKHSYFV